MRKLTFPLLALAALGATAQVNAGKALDYVNNHFNFTGYAQAGWAYNSESDPNNEFAVRRIMLMGEYNITDRWNAYAMIDLKAMSMHEYWVNFAVAPWMKWKLGQFKTPYTIENPISPSQLETIGLMSLPTTWMIGGGSTLMMPGSAGRDIGLTVYGDIDRWASYDLALMNGAGRNQGDDNSRKDFAARLTFHPLAGLDISGSLVLGKGAIETVALYDDNYANWTGNYKRNRFAAGFQLKTTPVNLRGEWMWGKDEDLDSNGGYATAQFNNVGVKNLDLVASADYLKIGQLKLSTYQAGVQYWFYKKCRIQVGYAYNDNHDVGGNSHSVLTQLQVGF